MPVDRVYTAEPTLHASAQSRHAVLSELDDNEFTQFIERRLDGSCARQARLLLSPERYRLLRHPYFLERYIEQHRQDLCIRGEAPVTSLDRLLEARLSAWLDHGGRLLGCLPDDLRPLVDALVAALWNARPSGLTLSDGAQIAESILPGQGLAAIRHLRQLGVLTAEGPIQLTEKPLAARLFAEHVERLRLADPRILGGLSLELDAPVTVALFSGIAQRPVALAEQLIDFDSRWLEPILTGLAQRSSVGPEVLAWLTVLDRPRWELVSVYRGAQAIGELAGGSSFARRWVARWYLSGRDLARHRGEVAVGALLATAPLRAEPILRLRLGRARRPSGDWSTSRERRKRCLQGALTPLASINTGVAAAVGRRALTEFFDIARMLPGEPDQVDLGGEIDTARGAIALYDDVELKRLLHDLEDRSDVVRVRASRALLPGRA